MEVSVSGRHTTVSESLKRQAEEKIGRLDRYLKGMERADVHFWEENNPRIGDKEICEVTMEGHGHHIRCKVSAPDGFTAIDLAVDKLERQLRKLKTKVQKQKHARIRPELPTDLVPETLIKNDGDLPEPVYSIVKAKRFKYNPMDRGEAALQMDLLNHDFYLFIDSETDLASVVYQRDDGDVGLISLEP